MLNEAEIKLFTLFQRGACDHQERMVYEGKGQIPEPLLSPFYSVELSWVSVNAGFQQSRTSTGKMCLWGLGVQG